MTPLATLNGQAEFDPTFAPVREKFRAGFENHILAFEALKTEIEGQQPERGLAQIAARAHKIAGVAGTLGFARIGAIASSLDQTINAGTAAGHAPSKVFDQIAPRLEDLLDRLEAELD